MRRLLAVPMIVLLVACVSDGDKANLQEASHINTQLGIDYARNKQIKLAEEKLLRAIEQDSSNAAAHSALAFVYQQREEFDLAERHYRRALSLDPSDSGVRNNFGVFLCSRGKTGEGEGYLLDAARDRNHATPEVAWTNAGLCFKSKDAEKAEGYFREALRQNPTFPDALEQMAALVLQKQDYVRARAFVQRYEQTGKVSPQMLWLASQIEAALGDVQAARKYQIRLKREFPDSEEAAIMLNTYRQ